MKLQCYHIDRSGYAFAVCEKAAEKYQIKTDVVPPGYQPEREAVVFLMLDCGYIESKVLNFCKALTTSKTKTVALAVFGKNEGGLDKLKAAVEESGVPVHEEIFKCTIEKKGLFGKAKITDAQIQECLTWMDTIIDKCHVN